MKKKKKADRGIDLNRDKDRQTSRQTDRQKENKNIQAEDIKTDHKKQTTKKKTPHTHQQTNTLGQKQAKRCSTQN